QVRVAFLVDSDGLARLDHEKGTDGLAADQDEYGDRVITADGELDRVEKARIVFGDEGARQRQNRIVHPRIRAAARRIV
ncbi:dephospho-CoA kinase, partial [Micrococcus sp. GbtcB5]|uniref:dephospho-CoA kinase n=1 Tax=Micrococcus sp. GbtcB5 TaxID=2824750 RepID=UPI001C2FCAE1